jgi:hypothetical protein
VEEVDRNRRTEMMMAVTRREKVMPVKTERNGSGSLRD